jgi:hypothetical protein
MIDSPTDLMAPWTIQSLPHRTREQITRAAKQEGLTVGQLLEKCFDEWERDGLAGPVQDGPASNLAGLAAVMEQARAMAESAGVPVPEADAKLALSLSRSVMRQARAAARHRPQQVRLEELAGNLRKLLET